MLCTFIFHKDLHTFSMSIILEGFPFIKFILQCFKGYALFIENILLYESFHVIFSFVPSLLKGILKMTLASLLLKIYSINSSFHMLIFTSINCCNLASFCRFFIGDCTLYVEEVGTHLFFHILIFWLYLTLHSFPHLQV